MLLQLIKKDILIAKKYVFIVLLVMAVIPCVVLVAPDIPAFIPFLYMVILGQLILLQAISQIEAKNPKATALLCAGPYPRHMFVLAKYALFFLIFFYCCIVHTGMMLLLNRAYMLDLTTMLSVLCISVLLFGIYMPIEFKHGFIKAKFFFTTIILLFAMGPSLLVTLLKRLDLAVALPASIPTFWGGILAFVCILITGISILVSVRIFSKKDL